MRVNWKTGLLLPGLLSVSVVLAVSTGCSKTDLSGSLVFVSGDADSLLKGNDPDVVVLQSLGRGAESFKADYARAAGSAAASRVGAAGAGKARGRVPEFVPDEIIVKYRPGVDPGTLAKGLVSRTYAEARSDRNTPRGATSLLRLSETARGTLPEKAVRDLTLSEIERIRSNPLVEYAEPNYILRVFFAPNDPLYPRQWHYPLVDLNELWADDALWADVQDLSGITVAVIDTGIAGGVSGTHPDLTDSPTLFRDQYDFQGALISDPDDDDANAEDPGSSYHGTHVTGTIAALTNNAIPTGIAGVAGGGGSGTGVRIMPLRALNDVEGGTVFDISRAVLYAAGLGADPAPPPKANVINMSLGTYGSSETLAQAIEDAAAAGLVVVAAAGNDATDLPSYPAAYPEVISVGAVAPGAEKAYYSNYISGFGGKVDMAAPGGSAIHVLKIDLDFDTFADDVLSTLGVSDYEYAAGTSMSTPHVAGTAALVRKAFQAAGVSDPSPAQIRAVLASTAGPLGSADFYGAGLLDVCRAVRTARGVQPSRPVLSTSPKTLRLYGNPPHGAFVVKNTGDDTAAIDVAAAVAGETDPGFIDVAPASASIPPGSGGVTFTVTASPGPFPPTLRYAMIEITSLDAETERVYVVHKEIGSVYAVAFEVITFSPFTTVPVAAVAASPFDGFRFSFGDVGVGYYLIGASTDRDGDGQLFDAGEAYGFYGAPDFDNATLIPLEAGDVLSELDFQIIDWE